MAKNVKKRGGDGGGNSAPVDQDEKMVRSYFKMFFLLFMPSGGRFEMDRREYS